MFRKILAFLPVFVLVMLILRASSEKAPAPKSPPVPEPSVTLAAVGDVLLDRGIDRRIREHGPEWAFEKVSAVLREADLAFCNLECPLTENGVKVSKPIGFKADPAHVQCLVSAGFDIVSLANNHSLDCSRLGLSDTMRYLNKHDILYTGAGDSLYDSALPTHVDVNGLKIAFLARNCWFPEGVWLKPDAPNAAPLDKERIEEEVADARAQADVVIVSLHWGIEYHKKPQPSQVELARKLIDAGADLILGHHPHVIQPVEEYNGGVIVYSMGNFLFDSPHAASKESMIFKCRLTRSGVSDFEVVPITLQDYRPVGVSTQNR